MVAKALTVSQFRRYIAKRKTKETFAAIATDLGVTRGAVENWHARRVAPPQIVLLAAAIRIQLDKRSERSGKKSA